MVDQGEYMQLPISNDVLMHYAVRLISEPLRRSVCNYFMKYYKDNEWKDRVEIVISSSDKDTDKLEWSSNGYDFIRNLDDANGFRLSSHISEKYYYRFMGVKTDGLDESNVEKLKSKRGACKTVWDSSEILYSERNIYSHAGADSCEFDDLKQVVDNVKKICDAAGFEDPGKIVGFISKSLADPTKNEVSSICITVGGRTVSEEEILETIDSDERIGGLVIENAGKKFVDGTLGIDEKTFFDILTDETGIDYRMDAEQYGIISSSLGRNLRVIAGPGSGKTMVMALNILKTAFIDGVDPSEMVVTTFTRKASVELKSRIMALGSRMLRRLLYNPDIKLAEKDRIRGISFVNMTIGTLDSIAYDILTEFRKPGKIPKMIADESLSRQIMFKNLIEAGGTLDQERTAVGYRSYGFMKNMEYCEYCLAVQGHIRRNCKRLDEFEDRIPLTIKVIKAYEKELRSRALMDFAISESEFLSFLESSESDAFLKDKKLLIVDEYQDTNLIQEKIYMLMAKAVFANGGSTKVVGDDDQAIYRFRGSDVSYFTALDRRAREYGLHFDTLFLTTNYRSNRNIVTFCNQYLDLDKVYERSDVEKPRIRASDTSENPCPVLGFFGKNKFISDSLVKFIDRLVHDGKVVVSDEDGNKVQIDCPEGFSGKDIAFLAGSTMEYDSNNKPRLPQKIHDRSKEASLEVCNPKGMPPSANVYLGNMMGMFIRCVDPNLGFYDSVRSGDTVFRGLCSETIDAWLVSSEEILKNPDFEKCRQYIGMWKEGKAYASDRWKDGVPVKRIFYDLIQLSNPDCNHPDSAVYSEMILRTMEQSTKFNRKVTKIRFDDKHMPSRGTISEVYRSVLVPLSNDLIRVDEDNLYAFPMDDMFNMMTIHQSKGLEFPVVVVDIERNSHDPDYDTHIRRGINDDSVIQMDRFFGTGLGKGPDAIYDDMIRKYYVAFSRAQDILILVGNRNPLKRVSNIGYDDHFEIMDVEEIL